MVRTSTLTGPALHHAVAVALGLTPKLRGIYQHLGTPRQKLVGHYVSLADGHDEFDPLTDKNLAMQLAWQYRIGLKPTKTPQGGENWTATTEDGTAEDVGDTPMIALCRCLVQWKRGSQVAVPEELTPKEQM